MTHKFNRISHLHFISLVGLFTSQVGMTAEVPEKLAFAFQKQKDPRSIQEHAERVAEILGDRIGIPVEVRVPTSYGATVQALISNRAHVAYVDSISFLLARSEAPVRLILVELRDGRTEYDSIFVVRKDSPLQNLAELRGKRMMFTSNTSTSGYVMAYSRLVNEGLLEKEQDPEEFFDEVGFAGGYDRALLAVLRGQADACAVSAYTMEGLKADIYLDAEQRDQLRVLTRTPGVPTHLICLRADLPEDLQEKIKASLLAISKDHPELLADVYGASEFVEADQDEHVAKTVEALKNTGLGPKGLVK